MINDDDEWLVHLIINGKQQPDDERAANTQTLIDSIESPGRFHLEQLPIPRRCWLDRGPEIAHGAALRWPVFDALGTPGLPYNEAPLVGVSSVNMHRLQPRLRAGDAGARPSRSWTGVRPRTRTRVALDRQALNGIPSRNDVRRTFLLCTIPN